MGNGDWMGRAAFSEEGTSELRPESCGGSTVVCVEVRETSAASNTCGGRKWGICSHSSPPRLLQLPSGVDGPPSPSLAHPLPLVLAHRHLWLPDFRSCCGSRCAPVLPLRGRGCGRCPSLHHPERAHLLPHLALLWAVSPFPTLSRAPGSQHNTWPYGEPILG